MSQSTPRKATENLQTQHELPEEHHREEDQRHVIMDTTEASMDIVTAKVSVDSLQEESSSEDTPSKNSGTTADEAAKKHRKSLIHKRVRLSERVHSYADSIKKDVQDEEKREMVKKKKKKIKAGLEVATDIAIEQVTNMAMMDPRIRAASVVVGVAVKQVKKQRQKQEEKQEQSRE